VTGPQRWVAAVVGGMLAMLAVGVLVGPRLLHATPSRTGGTHATVVSLPPGVCPLSTEGWPTGLTRIEAKLVTYESYFGSSTPDTASSARATQRTTSPPPYFWVIAATGNYDLNTIPRPAPATGTITIHSLWIYVRADQCAMGGAIHFPIETYAMIDGWPLSGESGNGSDGWPAWFDQMPAVMHTKIR